MSTANYVYVLKDPSTDEVRYVGRTVDPVQRFHRHRVPAGSKLWEWLCSLGDVPLLHVVCVVESHEAERVENASIEMFAKRGCNLVNKLWSRTERELHSRLIAQAYRENPSAWTKSEATRHRMSEAAIASWADGVRKGTPRDMSAAQAARWPRRDS